MVNSAQWKAFRGRFVREAARENRPCALCGGEIDYDASGRSRFGPQVDHILAVERGGGMLDLANCQITHATCNGSKAAGLDPRRGGGSVRRQLQPPARRVQLPVCNGNACWCSWVGDGTGRCHQGPPEMVWFNK